MKEDRIIIAGAGGQGIMFLGKIISEAAMLEGRHVTYLPAYGAEVRGGTANCMVIISDEEIGSPFVDSASIIVAMNQPSLERFGGRLKAGGTLVVNNSLAAVPKGMKKAISFPFTGIALTMGDGRTANMVCLGCLAKKTGVVKLETVFKLMQKFSAKKELMETNIRAITLGAELK
jgi:2-oxoglutarate ferredoxin oxidoreductase subunit gamma